MTSRRCLWTGTTAKGTEKSRTLKSILGQTTRASRFVCACVLLGGGLLSQTLGQVAPSSNMVPAVRGALESVRSGIRGDQSRYDLWNEALLLDQIDELLEAGDDADLGQLTKIINALTGAERPADKMLLENLRDKMQAWLVDQPTPKKLKIGKATGDEDEDKDADEAGDDEDKDADEDSDDEDKDAEAGDDEAEEDEEESEPEKQSELTTKGAEPVVEAIDNLKRWLRRQGPRYASWSDGLALDEIESLTDTPEEATRVELQKQLSRIITECNRQDRSDVVRLRRALQNWQVADRNPIDEPLAVETRRRKLRVPEVD